MKEKHLFWFSLYNEKKSKFASGWSAALMQRDVTVKWSLVEGFSLDEEMWETWKTIHK